MDIVVSTNDPKKEAMITSDMRKYPESSSSNIFCDPERKQYGHPPEDCIPMDDGLGYMKEHNKNFIYKLRKGT